MSIRLLCVVCSRGSEEFSLVNFLDDKGRAHIKQNLCDRCRKGRTLRCSTHRSPHVVLIDGSSVCPVCVRRQWVEVYDHEPANWQTEFGAIAKHVPKADCKEFLRVMRRAIDEPRAWDGQCLVTALVVFAHRKKVPFAVALRYARRMVAKKKSFFTILPSSDPKKRYTP